MKRLILGTLTAAVAVVVTAPASAQLEGVYIPPQCDIEEKHFLVKQASLYVKSATEARDPEKQNENLQDAFRVLQDALGRGEEGNPNVWYFLGRTYALVPDLAGVDSSFAKVERMLPECAEDTDSHRYNLWVPVYNEAVEALQVSDYQGAKTPLTQANIIYHKEPYVPFYLGTIWAQDATPDSAIKYFKETIAMAVDTGDYKETYDLSVFNTARLYHQKEMLDSAIVYYEAYRVLNPDDPTAITGLAATYEAVGNEEKAAELFNLILNAAETMSAMELFTTGVSLFNQENYETAAIAFSLGLEKNPYHRDGLYNLGQSYYAVASPDGEVKQGEEGAPELSDLEIARRVEAADSMLAATQRLVAVDPQNEDSQRLLAAAWQIQGNDDSTLAVIMRLDSLDYEIVVFEFQQSGDGYNIGGEIRNRKEEEITVPAINFDFIDESGTVLGSDTFPGATLAPDTSAEFQFTPMLESIAAWRYSVAGEGTEP